MDTFTKARKAALYMLSPSSACECINIEAQEWQKNVLEDIRQKLIIVSGRQVGKSTIISIKAGTHAKYKKNALVLVFAPTIRQANELFRKIKLVIEELPGAAKIVTGNATTIELSNGSRIVCLPGKAENVAGFTAPTMIIIDEACYAKDNLYRTVKPMLAASKGKMILISTPFIRSGFFYEIWDRQNRLPEDEREWSCYEIPAPMAPWMTPEYLAEERREMGEWWFMSQYMCKFQEAQDSLITSDMIDRAFHRPGEQDYKPLILTGEDPLYSRKTYESILL